MPIGNGARMPVKRGLTRARFHLSRRRDLDLRSGQKAALHDHQADLERPAARTTAQVEESGMFSGLGATYRPPDGSEPFAMVHRHGL